VKKTFHLNAYPRHIYQTPTPQYLFPHLLHVLVAFFGLAVLIMAYHDQLHPQTDSGTPVAYPSIDPTSVIISSPSVSPSTAFLGCNNPLLAVLQTTLPRNPPSRTSLLLWFGIGALIGECRSPIFVIRAGASVLSEVPVFRWMRTERREGSSVSLHSLFRPLILQLSLELLGRLYILIYRISLFVC
jgi:hypothetical protein